jgi:hypothetical protein
MSVRSSLFSVLKYIALCYLWRKTPAGVASLEYVTSVAKQYGYTVVPGSKTDKLATLHGTGSPNISPAPRKKLGRRQGSDLQHGGNTASIGVLQNTHHKKLTYFAYREALSYEK